MKHESYFSLGFRKMLPVTTGVIPFGAVMGTVCADAKLSFFQTVSMNVMAYAGAAQLASVDLMTKHALSAVVIATGLIINLRFLLYSAAMSPVLQKANFFTKFFCAYSLTDQSYAVMMANESLFKSTAQEVQFYLGSSACMMMTWHSSVMAGFVFGNFAPPALALDFAVPLSFLALLIPTLKNQKYLIVAIFSSVTAVMLHPLPYKLGLIVTALLSIVLAIFLLRRKGRA